MLGLAAASPVLGTSLALAPAARADSVVSSNWSGYAVHRSGVRFSSVSANWTQPQPRCRRGHRGYGAIWVGLGGFARRAHALEQIGTEVDCTSSGRTASSGWFEVIPAPSQDIRLKVRPGDQMAASVTVVGHTVWLTLANLTTHQTFRKSMKAAAVDVSSAEWILEAPAECDGYSCQTLPLVNFGAATFGLTRTSATSGHAGTISDPAWGYTKIRLRPLGRRFAVLHGGGRAGTADPSALSSDGGTFTLTFSSVQVKGKRLRTRGQRRRHAARIVHPRRLG